MCSPGLPRVAASCLSVVRCEAGAAHITRATLHLRLTPRHSTRERKPTRGRGSALLRARAGIGPTHGPGPRPALARLAVTRDIAGAGLAGYLQYNPSYCRVTIITVCGAPGHCADHEECLVTQWTRDIII